MAPFRFLSMLVPAAVFSASKITKIGGFEITSLAKVKCGLCYQSKQQRPLSALLASLQQDRKQAIPNDDQVTAGVQKHVQYHPHHLQSPDIIIQGNEAEAKTHYGHENQHHNIKHQHQQPFFLSTLEDKIDHAYHAQRSTHRTEYLVTSIGHQFQRDYREDESHVLTIEEMSPIFQWTNKKGKTKLINLYGLYNIFIVVATMPFWLLSMEVLQRLGDAIEGFDDNRGKFDYCGKIWCRTYLRLVDSYPEIAGDVSRLKNRKEGGYGGACLFVANHASFLDIAVLCTVLDPVFKFIAKDSLAKFPGVGKQLVGGEHVLIDRNDKRSQLRSFKQAINYLNNGIPIMAFPEGARSPDGRLMAFKPGLFSMAVKAKVPIVPLSIANAHAVMPSVGLVSVQRGKGKLRVYVHDPIAVDGKSEEQISEEVRKALLTELPRDQHPL